MSWTVNKVSVDERALVVTVHSRPATPPVETRYHRSGMTGIRRHFDPAREQRRQEIIKASGLVGKIANYRRSDAAKGLRTDITPAQCLDLLLKQNGRCCHYHEDVGLAEMSVNRACNGRGHIMGNLNIVHPACNSALR